MIDKCDFCKNDMEWVYKSHFYCYKCLPISKWKKSFIKTVFYRFLIIYLT